MNHKLTGLWYCMQILRQLGLIMYRNQSIIFKVLVDESGSLQREMKWETPLGSGMHLCAQISCLPLLSDWHRSYSQAAATPFVAALTLYIMFEFYLDI
jgi:hypothetical protein